MARKMIDGLEGLPGIKTPQLPNGVSHTWYAFVVQYEADELNGLPIERFYEALQAEGCFELDRPGSTCPLNYHPLFQCPGELFPQYEGKLGYQRGDFPVAEHFHENSLKLPVWHTPEDESLVDLYLDAFHKVVDHHKELL